MGRLLLSLMVLMVLVACDSTDEGMGLGPEGYYELSSVNSGMSGLIVDREDLDFSESIEFFADSTFVKNRVYADSSSTASGNYSSLVMDGHDYLKLQYDNDTYLIQSCGPHLEEYLRVLNETEIFNGSYLPCDGPGYHYIRSRK
ncbi:hypothetical protein [Flagellimonas oceanensis]|uniref:hypothetical protein n=1 Tax=Flagellimonas oceanensis TaxID=2499163 RepID=UPI003BACA816